MLRFIARPQQYTLMPSVQLIHHHQAEQRDVINSETALTETTVNGKVSVLSVETTNHSCRMDKNAADMGVACLCGQGPADVCCFSVFASQYQ